MSPLLLLAMLAAAPKPSVEGLDKPKKAQTGKLGKSETAPGGVVTVRCFDAGAVMVVEVNDPGLMGAADAWLQKRKGNALPPCDGNADAADPTRLDGVIGYGYVLGTKGDFLFVQSADGFGDRMGLRVLSLTTGALVLDVERSVWRPATLKAEGDSLWLRYHEAVVATCDPVGDAAERCWQEVRDAAKVPADLDVKPPPCAKDEEQRLAVPGSSQLAFPVEVDLKAPMTKRFRTGETTCGLAPWREEGTHDDGAALVSAGFPLGRGHRRAPGGGRQLQQPVVAVGAGRPPPREGHLARGAGLVEPRRA
ncbi:MAG: hypothetical protein AB1730_00270 [Myxococcota bacterium]|jgi:hypothetical protein